MFKVIGWNEASAEWQCLHVEHRESEARDQFRDLAEQAYRTDLTHLTLVQVKPPARQGQEPAVEILATRHGLPPKILTQLRPFVEAARAATVPEDVT